MKAVMGLAELVGSADGLGRRLWLLVGLAVAAFAVAALVADTPTRLGVVLAGLTLLALAGIVGTLIGLHRWMDRRGSAMLDALVGEDASPCFATDDTGAIGFQNAAARARFGLADGATLVSALHDHFASPGSVLFRLQSRAAAGGTAREDVVTRHGHIRLSAHRIADGRFLWRLEKFQDRTDGRGAKTPSLPMPVPDGSADTAALADFESVPVALMRFTPDGRLLLANRAAREMLSLDPQDAVGFTDLFEGLGRSIHDWLADIAGDRRPAGAEVLRDRRGAEDSFIQVSLRRTVESGRVGILAVLTDATALKTLEAQFTQSQKMQAIGLLAGGIAHDFNNLLTAISGHCDLLLLRHDETDPEYADLMQIHQNSNRAAALVSQLLAFSRKQKLQPQRLELHEVLADLAHLLNRLVGERVSLRIAHGHGLGPVRADKRQLEQVVVNLVVNARDAMTEGGIIRIETEALTLAQDLPRDRTVVPRGDYAIIRVIDTGHGIPADRLDKIFEPFYTTKRSGEGTGLGLSTAYGIVKQSGGYIFVDSEQGRGTAFHLYFPIHHGQPEPVVAPAPVVQQAPARHGAGVVLLVEDEAPVRAVASRALRLRGYTVLEAENAEDALRTLEDPAVAVDIFVTDVVMPGMDGPSWVRKALELRPDVRVVFVSGYSEESLWDSQDRIPNSVFLPKPFSLSELTAVVQGQLH